MPKVTIVGAGVAGLTAALRLAERGYEVTMFERDSFVGGKFRATEWNGDGRAAYHEHSYHMFLNWYHNFLQIAKDIDVLEQFMPLTKVRFLYRGEFPNMKELVNFGSPSSVLQNLFSGVLPVPHMFLYMYSVIDLLSTPLRGGFRDLISVNGFASTRLYATERSVRMYDEYLAKAFAIASYETSAKTFRTFLQYGVFRPEPLYLALKGDSFNYFLRPLQTRLADRGVKFCFNHEATKIHFDADGLVSKVTFRLLPETFNPSLNEISSKEAIRIGRIQPEMDKETSYQIDGPVIFAIPHSELKSLISPDFLNRDINLGETAKLRSVPMASVHLHLKNSFTTRLKDNCIELPREPVILVDSKFKLSFVDNSRLWSQPGGTYLNIVASDSRPLNLLEAPIGFTADRLPGEGRPDLQLASPQTTLDYILNEFRSFIYFSDDEIDIDLLQIDRNAGRELFMNQVGSWGWRPSTKTKVPNLFLAGDFCKTSIDVVCLEGAVVSGLEAAEHVRRRTGLGPPIRTISPKKYPTPLFWPLKLALAPYAAGARVWAAVDKVLDEFK
jgi:zeta-carotene desaturase